ncbi:MAG: hypothetical protein HPY61_13765 [Methanotrichaceae archaeon]|nr:hypothetical protein [Methanotrichaceae archaeon]
MSKKNRHLIELGRTGLTRFGGYIYEEWLAELQGSKGALIYKKMADSDAIIGGMLFAFREICKSAPWFAVPAGNEPEDLEAAKFLESCLYDMASPWPSTVDEILSMLPFGWAYLETIFKFRRGPKQKSPKYRSQYNDGRIGWLKWAPRAQESFNQWIYDEETDQLLGLSQTPAPDYQERRIPLDKALHFVTTSAKGNPEGRSILRNSYRSWYMKTNIEDIEGMGLERDMVGYPTLYLPLEIMKRETPEAEEAYQEYFDLITNVRRDEAEGLLLPSVFDDHGNRLYEFKLTSSPGVRQFDTSRIISRYDTRIALTIMADFLLLGQQKQGSYALSETKARMFYQALTSVLDNIAETINSQAVPTLFELNPWWDLEELSYIAHGKVELPNLEVLGEYIQKLTKAGIKLFPDERLENHLRGLADLPIRDTKHEPARTEERPAFSEQDQRQGAKPELDDAEEAEA